MDIIIQTERRQAPSFETYIKEGQGRNIYTFT